MTCMPLGISCWARPKILVKWRHVTWRPTDCTRISKLIRHLLLLLNLKKKNSAKFISSPNMSWQTTRIVTKLFSWAHTQSLLFSLSHVLYLNTRSQLFVLRLLFFLVFEKTYLYSGCSATKTHFTCKEGNPGWHALQTHSIRRQSSWYENEGRSRKMYVNSTCRETEHWQ
jgi:hypothetical protein